MANFQIVRDLTPPQLECGLGPACPAILELSDGALLLIGKTVSLSSLPKEVQARISSEETPVMIPRELVSGLVK